MFDAGVVRSDAEPVEGDRHDEDGERALARGRDADQRRAEGEEHEGGAHRGGAVAAPGQGLREHGSGAREEDEHEHEPGQLELAEVELLLELRQP